MSADDMTDNIKMNENSKSRRVQVVDNKKLKMQTEN